MASSTLLGRLTKSLFGRGVSRGFKSITGSYNPVSGLYLVSITGLFSKRFLGVSAIFSTSSPNPNHFPNFNILAKGNKPIAPFKTFSGLTDAFNSFFLAFSQSVA